LETLVEIVRAPKDSEQLTEMTRQRLARQITSAYKGPDGAVASAGMLLDAVPAVST
jgi:flagellar biosynthesis component FlhA